MQNKKTASFSAIQTQLAAFKFLGNGGPKYNKWFFGTGEELLDFIFFQGLEDIALHQDLRRIP